MPMQATVKRLNSALTRNRAREAFLGGMGPVSTPDYGPTDYSRDENFWNNMLADRMRASRAAGAADYQVTAGAANALVDQGRQRDIATQIANLRPGARGVDYRTGQAIWDQPPAPPTPPIPEWSGANPAAPQNFEDRVKWARLRMQERMAAMSPGNPNSGAAGMYSPEAGGGTFNVAPMTSGDPAARAAYMANRNDIYAQRKAQYIQNAQEKAAMRRQGQDPMNMLQQAALAGNPAALQMMQMQMMNQGQMRDQQIRMQLGMGENQARMAAVEADLARNSPERLQQQAALQALNEEYAARALTDTPMTWQEYNARMAGAGNPAAGMAPGGMQPPVSKQQTPPPVGGLGSFFQTLMATNPQQQTAPPPGQPGHFVQTIMQGRQDFANNPLPRFITGRPAGVPQPFVGLDPGLMDRIRARPDAPQIIKKATEAFKRQQRRKGR